MKKTNTVVTRRDFIRGTVGATLGATLLGPDWLKGKEAGAGVAAGSSTVVIARDQAVLDEGMHADKAVLRKMLGQVLTGVTGETDTKTAWLKLFGPKDVIGLVPTPFMNPTHDELIEVVTETLVEAGVPAGNIRKAQGRSVDLAPITALVCMPGLKAHWLTGTGTVIKNYILYSGAPRNYHYADSAKLGEIWNLPQVKGKTKLVLVDALRPVCDKGPQFDPRYRWPYRGLIAGIDPVAVEAVGLKIIQAKRDEMRGEPWPLQPPPICVEAAEKVYKLGTSDLAKIDIKTVGWTEGLLV
ncbi:MAG TPA: DUF362 domain-containing protein [Candidatus Aminicenantes bacterium]|nr:DUF362 domain-containing protein [Candidatus Aminicenantes bacterium]